MRRILAAVALWAVGTLGVGADAPEASAVDSGVPELVVDLAPATGFVPLDSGDPVVPYRFQVSAFDQERRHIYGSASAFVRPGQDRVVDETRAESRVLGSIRFGTDGVAMYTAELQRNGRSVARTSATVRVVPPR